MRARIDRINDTLPVKLLFALFGVLLLLANGIPGKSYSAADSFDDVDFVTGIGVNGYAVIPKFEREKRQRDHEAFSAAAGKTSFVPPLQAVAEEFVALGFLPDRSPARFHHLEESPSLSRGPPILL